MYIKLGKIEAPKHTVSFDANGGAGTMTPLVVNEDEATPLTANSFTREDCAFKGWNTKADGSGTAYADGADITVSAAMGDTTLYAQWVQATATLKIGQNVNAALKTLAKGSSASYSTTDTLIKNLSFVDTLPSTVDENTPRVNIALDGEIPVYAYWVANDEAIYINTEADKIYANNDSSYMFYYMQALTSLTFPDSFNTSNVTNMGSMFSGMQALTSLTLPDSFDTSNVTDMSTMFSDMYALTSLTLPDSFVIASETDTDGIFTYIRNTATLYATDATARSLWPGVLGN
jgi:surface protein